MSLSLPPKKIHLYPFHLQRLRPPGGTDGYIQNVTALVMLMVQSCVTSPPVLPGVEWKPGDEGDGRPGDDRGDTPGGDGGGGNRASKRRRHHQDQQQSGLNPARSAATYFISRFLSRYVIFLQ